MHNRKLEQENETDVEKRKDFFGCARKRSVKISKSQKATMDLKPADEVHTENLGLLIINQKIYVWKKMIGFFLIQVNMAVLVKKSSIFIYFILFCF